VRAVAPDVSPFVARANGIEGRRRLVVRTVLFIYVLSLIEGPLRKWFLPEYALSLNLLRDPFVAMLYLYCMAHGMIWTRGVAKLWLALAVITSILGLAQYVVSGFDVWYWLLGVRTYWLYLPLAFVVARTFQQEDIHRFLRLNILIAVPYAFLVAQQYNAPPLSVLNRGVGGDESGAVGLAYGVVRPFGLFTYTGPNVQFTAAMIAMIVAFYLGGASMRYRSLFLMVGGVAIAAMSVLTGTRVIYFLAAMIIGLTITGLQTRPSSRMLTRSLGVVGFVVLAGLLLISIFPDMLDAMAVRMERSELIEGSIWNRVFDVLFGWSQATMTASVLGAGIGAGAPGVTQFLGLPPLIYGESDLQRNLNELGLILGLAMLTLRFATAGWIVWLAYRLAMRGEAMALPLAGFVCVPMLLGQITHSTLNGFMVWLVLGLVVALNRCSTVKI